MTDPGFPAWLDDESRVSFPWSMIDKITPRPSKEVQQSLEADGIEGMETTVRTGSGSTHVAWGGEEKQKVKNGTYAYGNSACKVRASTGSGSIRISGN